MLDPEVYDRLAQHRAVSLGISVEQLMEADFFPAYRLTEVLAEQKP